MNDGRNAARSSFRLASAALATVLITVSCADGDVGVPTAAPAHSPTVAPTPMPTPPALVTSAPSAPPSAQPSAVATATPPTPPSPPEPSASPEAEASESSLTHRSMVVAIPDAAAASPEMDEDAAATTAPGSSDPTATVVPIVVEDSVDTTEKRLNVSVGGETVFIRNGGRIDMGDGLAVEIYIDPYPPTTLHSILDVYVTRDGEPIEDISVDVEFDMLSMLHGPFAATAKDIGGGHHLATLDYIMFGAWDQFVTIRLGLDRIRFPVVIVAYP